jgi:hypothetical protein
MLGLVKPEFINIISGQHYAVAISYLSVIIMLLFSHLIIVIYVLIVYHNISVPVT